MKFIIEELQLRNITKISKESGAKLAAKALLYSRQAFLENQKLPASSDAEENSSTVESRSAPTNDGENNVTVATTDEEESNTTVATSDEEESNTTVATSDEGESNTTATSKRSRAETDWDGTDSDDTRASKRSCREADLNNTITSEGGRFQSLVEAAVEVAGQNATASETTIANLASGVDTMQLNYARPSNSETGYLNSVDLQGRGPEEHNAIAPSVLNNNTKPDASLPNTSGFKDMATSLPNGDPPMTHQFFLNGQTISLDASFEDMATSFPNGDPPMTEQFFLNGQTVSLDFLFEDMATLFPNGDPPMTEQFFLNGKTLSLDASSPNTNTRLLNDEEFRALINDDALLTEFRPGNGKSKPVDASDTNTLQTGIHHDGELIAGSPIAGERF